MDHTIRFCLDVGAFSYARREAHARELELAHCDLFNSILDAQAAESQAHQEAAQSYRRPVATGRRVALRVAR